MTPYRAYPIRIDVSGPATGFSQGEIVPAGAIPVLVDMWIGSAHTAEIAFTLYWTPLASTSGTSDAGAYSLLPGIRPDLDFGVSRYHLTFRPDPRPTPAKGYFAIRINNLDAADVRGGVVIKLLFQSDAPRPPPQIPPP